MLRDAVRSLAEAKIAPHAAAVDEEARFPREALDALTANDLHAVHVPEEYGGAGRRRARHGHRDRGGGPRLRVLLPHPGREQAGLAAGHPLRLRGAEEEVHGPLARGEAMFSYCLSEPDAGSDAAGMKTRAVRDGDFWVLNGVKRWITNAGRVRVLHGDGRHRPGEALQGHLRLRRGEVRPGRLLRRAGEEARHQGLAHPRGLPGQRPHPRRPHDRRGGHRLRHRDAHPGPHPHHHRRAGPRHRPGRARLRQGLRQGAQAVRQAGRRLPGRAVHARRHGHEDRGRPPAHLRRRGEVRAGRQRPHLPGRRRQVLRLRRGHGGHHGRRPAPRRLRLHPRLPGRAHDRATPRSRRSTKAPTRSSAS